LATTLLWGDDGSVTGPATVVVSQLRGLGLR